MAIERELKFRLAARAARHAARELALGRPLSFSSTYFDTPERELSAARAAFRLRRVGRAWLQAFKCEQAPGARGEWEVMLARGELQVLALPCAEIRGASGIDLMAIGRRLRPLFETRFRRRTTELAFGEATLEVALDQGDIVAGRRREPIRELELELKSGAASAMLRYGESLVEAFALELSLASKAERGYRLAAGEAGTPRKWRRPALADAKPHEALARLAAAALEQIAANAAGVIESDDPEYLHQLRVGVRRLRSLFGFFRELEPSKRALRARLREFGPALGKARDWDVLAPSLRTLPPAAVKARAAARTLVASPPFQRTLLRIMRWIEEAPWRTTQQPLAAFAADALERLHRKAMKTAARVQWHRPADRHALRIRIKRLRYASDAFADCFPAAGARTYLKALERLQHDFGELNDRAVARRLVKTLPRDASGEERLIARAQRDWRAFERRPVFWRGGK